jgi:hypothetical protein
VFVLNVQTMEGEVLQGTNGSFTDIITFCAFSPVGPQLVTANDKGSIFALASFFSSGPN